jgi:phosphohistidine phosphatase
MRRLILLRHGEAERRAFGGGDLDRQLTPRGLSDAAAVARALADRGLVPTLALVSIAARTVETWEAAATAFPHPEVKFLRGLYDASSEALWTMFGEHEAQSAMLVAHNPGIHSLAVSLAQRSVGAAPSDLTKLLRDFPPAACAAFAIEPGKVTLETVIFPEDLPGAAA